MKLLSRVRRLRGGALSNLAAGIVVGCIVAGGTAYAANTIGSADIINNSVQGIDIKDRTIRAPDLVGAPWVSVGSGTPGVACSATSGKFCVTPDGLTDFQNYGGAYQHLRFRRDATNTVTLQGRVAYVQAGFFEITTVFYLPVNYRPSGQLVFSVNCSDSNGFDVAGAIQVAPDGAVDWFRNDKCNGGWIDLTGISFPIN